MPVVNVNDLNNAKIDCDTIAGVATSSAPTVTDRLGNTKNTLAGMNAAVLASAAAVQGSIGYLPPVAYAAGISLTLAAQTVGYSGQTYAPIFSALPFTTSGTFETVKFRLIQGVAGADLSASGGAGMVGFGSAGRTVKDQLDMLYFGIANVTDPKFMGGALDNGTDQTAQIQAAIDSLPSGGWLHGAGKTFVVTSLFLKSNMSMGNINLKTIAGSTTMQSPVTIDGRTVAKKNIRLFDMVIDGNRINRTGIITPSAEDGGMHGIRCIGALSDFYLERVQANNCASYGFLLYSSISAGTNDDVFVFTNINITDCKFNGNRAHGMAADSVRGMRINGAEFRDNGNDINTVDPLTSGTRASRSGALQYGTGFDFEGYGIGSSMRDIYLHQVTATGNARMGGLFMDQLATRGVGFVPRQNIFISNSTFDKGNSASQDETGLQFTCSFESLGLVSLYENILISNTRIDGRLLLRGVKNVEFTGEIKQDVGADYVILDRAINVNLNGTPIGLSKGVGGGNSTYKVYGVNPVFPKNPSLTSIGSAGTLVNTVCAPQAVFGNTYRYLITADWTIGTAGGATFRITPPAGFTIIGAPSVDVISSATAFPIIAAYYLASNYAKFSDPGTALLQLQFVVDIQ